MGDTRDNRLGGGAGCWAGRASIPTANWWRRGGARRAGVRAVSAGRASLPTFQPHCQLVAEGRSGESILFA